MLQVTRKGKRQNCTEEGHTALKEHILFFGTEAIVHNAITLIDNKKPTLTFDLNILLLMEIKQLQEKLVIQHIVGVIRK